MATRKNNNRLVIPVLVLFAIITISQASYGNSYGGSGFLSLQPTAPIFQSSNLFSGGLSYASSPIMPTYNNYQSSGFGSLSFSSRALPIYQTYQSYSSGSFFSSFSYNYRPALAEPIYFTPTTALFNVNYGYRNFAQAFDP